LARFIHVQSIERKDEQIDLLGFSGLTARLLRETVTDDYGLYGGGKGMRTMEAAGAPAALEGRDRSTRARLRELLRVSGGSEDTASDELLDELEREVALLREENARLKLAREHADERPVTERVRAAFPPPRGDEEPDGEDPWEALTECMLMRETLLDACRELERGAAELRTRLETLLVDESAMRLSSDLERVT
jgi:hypothetical protein